MVLLCFVVTLFDGFDTQAIAFAGPAVAQALGAVTAWAGADRAAECRLSWAAG